MSGDLEEVDLKKLKELLLSSGEKLEPNIPLTGWCNDLEHSFREVYQDLRGRRYGFILRGGLNARWGSPTPGLQVFRPRMELQPGDHERRFFYCMVVFKMCFFYPPLEFAVEFIGTYDWNADPQLLT